MGGYNVSMNAFTPTVKSSPPPPSSMVLRPRGADIAGTSYILSSSRIQVRLIIEPDAAGETIMVCTEIEVEGVVDYHGRKENWFIP